MPVRANKTRQIKKLELRFNQNQSSSSKKQGATGITTVAPYIAGQWGRGNNRLPG
jgi:hypothetical protein